MIDLDSLPSLVAVPLEVDHVVPARELDTVRLRGACRHLHQWPAGVTCGCWQDCSTGTELHQACVCW